jgi:hypothetical protein
MTVHLNTFSRDMSKLFQSRSPKRGSGWKPSSRGLNRAANILLRKRSLLRTWDSTTGGLCRRRRTSGRSIRRKSNGYRRSQDKVLRRGTANPGSGPRRGGGNRTRQIAVAGRSLNKIAEHTRKAESTFNQMAKATRRNFHEIGEDTASAWIDERKSIRATSTLGNRQPAEPRSQPQSSICIVRVSASLRRVKREWRASGFQDSADNASFGP